MRSTPSDGLADPDNVETMPATHPVTESAMPASDAAFDSEAPTAVHARHPLFAGPPRLPRT
jgi:hypothetical protein